MAVPIGAIDHCYSRKERRPSIRKPYEDHTYVALQKTDLSEQPRGTPTGKSPLQPVKSDEVEHGQKSQTPWSHAEKEFFTLYVKETPRSNQTMMSYWKQCADVINSKFPEHCRNGISCKSMSRRLFVVPSQADEPCTSIEQSSESVHKGTQTDLCLPVNYNRNEHEEGEWVHMELKKSLEETASKGAQELHYSVLKGLGSAQQFARALMMTSFGKEVIKQLINDIEMDAREFGNRGSKSSS